MIFLPDVDPWTVHLHLVFSLLTCSAGEIPNYWEQRWLPVPGVLAGITSLVERNNFSLESDMGILMLVKIYLIKDVTRLLRKAHWTHITSTVFSSLLFQMDLVELQTVQKMATETIWLNGTTVKWGETEKRGTLHLEKDWDKFIIEIYKIMKVMKKPGVKLLPSKSCSVRTRGHSVKVVGDQI